MTSLLLKQRAFQWNFDFRKHLLIDCPYGTKPSNEFVFHRNILWVDHIRHWPRSVGTPCAGTRLFYDT